MVQVLDRIPGFGELLARGLGNSAGTAAQAFGQNAISQRQAQQQQLASQQENETISKLLGQDLGGINDPKMKALFIEQLLKGQGESNKQQAQRQEKIAPLQVGLKTIERMKQISGKNKLGRGSGFKSLFGGETARDIGEYEQLGKSLISLASTIPIRNQKEFETLSEKLYDSSLPDAEREGVLAAMENIIKGSLSQFEGSENPNMMETQEPIIEKKSEKQSEKPLVKFDISNPEHKKRRDMVLKKTGGDRSKAEAVLRKEFDL